MATLKAYIEAELRNRISTSSRDSSRNDSAQSLPEDDHLIIGVAAHGDIVLRISHQTATDSAVHSFRVSSPSLKKTSKYFDRVLQAGRFGEAVAIEAKHQELLRRYGNMPAVPSTELPVLEIKDVGRISAVKAVDALLTDFLYILHGKDTQTFPPVANLANLAIVADRFDALDVVRHFVKRKKMIRAREGKTTPKMEASLNEEKVRQRLLVGILLDHPAWVRIYSIRLIVKGWVGNEAEATDALYWDLPYRIEEELAYRRECILESIQSLQSHYLAIYASRDRQCKLGYDNSAQCDSFQLGEMIRFFTRVGTVQAQGTLAKANDSAMFYEGDLHVLIDTLRQVPEYQIDKFHHHCGIRTKMLPKLDRLEECLKHIGICAECWFNNRTKQAWIGAKRPLLWREQDFRLKEHEHGDFHADVRALFTATQREWQ